MQGFENDVFFFKVPGYVTFPLFYSVPASSRSQTWRRNVPFPVTFPLAEKTVPVPVPFPGEKIPFSFVLVPFLFPGEKIPFSFVPVPFPFPKQEKVARSQNPEGNNEQEMAVWLES